jgi:serine/threonine protein kinase
MEYAPAAGAGCCTHFAVARLWRGLVLFRRAKACVVASAPYKCFWYTLGCCPCTSCIGSQTLYAFDEEEYVRKVVRPAAPPAVGEEQRQRELNDTTWRGDERWLTRRRRSGVFRHVRESPAVLTCRAPLSNAGAAGMRMAQGSSQRGRCWGEWLKVNQYVVIRRLRGVVALGGVGGGGRSYLVRVIANEFEDLRKGTVGLGAFGGGGDKREGAGEDDDGEEEEEQKLLVLKVVPRADSARLARHEEGGASSALLPPPAAASAAAAPAVAQQPVAAAAAAVSAAAAASAAAGGLATAEHRAAKRLLHENVLRITEVITGHAECDFVVSEHCGCGPLAMTGSDGGAFEAGRARAYARQIVRALEYCHRSGVVHRALSLENCLLLREVAGESDTLAGAERLARATAAVAAGPVGGGGARAVAEANCERAVAEAMLEARNSGGKAGAQAARVMRRKRRARPARVGVATNPWDVGVAVPGRCEHGRADAPVRLLRLAGFGLARVMDARHGDHGGGGHGAAGEAAGDECWSTSVGPTANASPESLGGTAGGYSGKKADAWALGCMLYRMLFGVPPFRGGSNYETQRRIVEEELRFPPPHCGTGVDGAAQLAAAGPLCEALLRGLLQKDPAKRLGLGEVLRDPWLTACGALPIERREGAAEDPPLLAELLGRRRLLPTGSKQAQPKKRWAFGVSASASAKVKGGKGPGSSRRTAPQRVDARVGGAQEQRLRELLEAWPHAAASAVRAVPRALPHLGPGAPLWLAPFAAEQAAKHCAGPSPRTNWVVPGVLLAGSHPFVGSEMTMSGGDSDNAVRRATLRQLLGAGVSVLVSLEAAGELHPKAPRGLHSYAEMADAVLGVAARGVVTSVVTSVVASAVLGVAAARAAAQRELVNESRHPEAGAKQPGPAHDHPDAAAARAIAAHTAHALSGEEGEEARLGAAARRRAAKAAAGDAFVHPRDLQLWRRPMPCGTTRSGLSGQWLRELLAELEEAIAQGHVVFLHAADDADGRTLSVAACLLGRLYRLSAEEALRRAELYTLEGRRMPPDASPLVAKHANIEAVADCLRAYDV